MKTVLLPLGFHLPDLAVMEALGFLSGLGNIHLHGPWLPGMLWVLGACPIRVPVPVRKDSEASFNPQSFAEHSLWGYQGDQDLVPASRGTDH